MADSTIRTTRRLTRSQSSRNNLGSDDFVETQKPRTYKPENHKNFPAFIEEHGKFFVGKALVGNWATSTESRWIRRNRLWPVLSIHESERYRQEHEVNI